MDIVLEGIMPYLLHIYSNCYADDNTICKEKCIK